MKGCVVLERYDAMTWVVSLKSSAVKRNSEGGGRRQQSGEKKSSEKGDVNLDLTRASVMS